MCVNLQEPAGHQQQEVGGRRHSRRARIPTEEIPVSGQQERDQVPGQDSEQVTADPLRKKVQPLFPTFYSFGLS